MTEVLSALVLVVLFGLIVWSVREPRSVRASRRGRVRVMAVDGRVSTSGTTPRDWLTGQERGQCVVSTAMIPPPLDEPPPPPPPPPYRCCCRRDEGER